MSEATPPESPPAPSEPRPEPAPRSEPAPEPQPEPERQELFTASSTLLLMLIVFALLAVMSLLGTMSRPEHEARTTLVTMAYSPGDFPEVFTADDPLQGLDDVEGQALPVEPPPFENPDDYPCSQCHEGDPGDPTRRQMEYYHEQIVLDHDEEHRWCLDCHMADNRDVLHSADMSPIPFEESYRLCGQCHGTQFRDWRAGAHGRRTGYWNGPRRYLLCVHCHNPHSPAFQPLEPLPPPVMPSYLREAETPPERREGAEP